MPKGGQLTIRTYTTVTDKKMVCADIEDTGPGIPANILNKVFDPFFTTKDVGKGTGLGLSVSYGIIKRFNGEIKVESKLNEGSKFTISIPIKQN